MSKTPSAMSLHLRYRLWIAEMNYDINVLRIFEDYLVELADKKNEEEVKTGVEYFQKQFVNFRKEIDELRHDMHLIKMKLAAYVRQMKQINEKIYESDNHTALKNNYLTFRKSFEKCKTDFKQFEGQWL